MSFNISEVNHVPSKKSNRIRASKYDPIIEACMASGTGIVCVSFDSIEECRKVATSLHLYCKKRNMVDLFTIRQRRENLYVVDETRRSA